MENRSHALAAGIFTLLFLIAAAVALWWLGQDQGRNDRYVLETRRNVTGLNLQAQVRYRGIRAGKVDSIEPSAADPRILQVRISLDSKFKLTRGTTAQLGYQGVTGLAYVQLEDDGSNPAPLQAKEGEAPRIELKPTLLDTLGDKAGDIVTQVSAVTSRLSRLLDEKNTQNVARTLDNLATASDSARELPALMASLREALSEQNLKQLKQILAHLEKTAGETAPLTVEARNAVKSVTALTQRLDRIATGTGDEVAATTLPQANALMRELSANSRQLNRLLDNLENNPQMLLFGRSGGAPGPGEAGFAAPTKQGESR